MQAVQFRIRESSNCNCNCSISTSNSARLQESLRIDDVDPCHLLFCSRSFFTLAFLLTQDRHHTRPRARMASSFSRLLVACWLLLTSSNAFLHAHAYSLTLSGTILLRDVVLLVNFTEDGTQSVTFSHMDNAGALTFLEQRSPALLSPMSYVVAAHVGQGYRIHALYQPSGIAVLPDYFHIVNDDTERYIAPFLEPCQGIQPTPFGYAVNGQSSTAYLQTNLPGWLYIRVLSSTGEEAQLLDARSAASFWHALGDFVPWIPDLTPGFDYRMAMTWIMDYNAPNVFTSANLTWYSLAFAVLDSGFSATLHPKGEPFWFDNVTTVGSKCTHGSAVVYRRDHNYDQQPQQITWANGGLSPQGRVRIGFRHGANLPEFWTTNTGAYNFSRDAFISVPETVNHFTITYFDDAGNSVTSITSWYAALLSCPFPCVAFRPFSLFCRFDQPSFRSRELV